MRPCLIATALLVLAFPSIGRAQVPLGATDITAEQVRQFVAQLPKDAASDRPIRVVDAGGYKIGVFGVFRPASVPDNAIIHDRTKMTEIYYILEGAGTLVTGGKLKEPVTRGNSNSSSSMINVRGTEGVEGGTTRRLGKGDLVIIPPGVVHWWSARQGDLTYLIVRPDPQNELTLK